MQTKWNPVSPEGRDIVIRPIELADIDHMVLRCWPTNRDTLDRLFREQGTLGMAAWEEEVCVAQLHGYQVALPAGRNSAWPAWNDWWSPRWNLELARQAGLERGSAWCHTCCHVGRTLAAAQLSDDPDPRYFGRGIGTALCRASVQWAREHGYTAVIAPGTPAGLFQFAVWAGGLPFTTYVRLGFEPLAYAESEPGLPGWAQGQSPPEVMAEVNAALAAGRPESDFHAWIMVLRLEDSDK